MVSILRNTPALQCGGFLRRLVLRFDEEGLEFIMVFISYRKLVDLRYKERILLRGFCYKKAATPKLVDR